MAGKQEKDGPTNPAQTAAAITTQTTRTSTRTAAGTTDNLIVHLCCADGTPLKWKSIASVTSTIAEPGPEDHRTCPIELPHTQGSDADDVVLYLHAPALRIIQIGAEAKRIDTGNAIRFMSMLTSVDCEGPALHARMFERTAPAESLTAQGLTTLTIQADWYVTKAGHPQRVRAAEIASATAELIPHGTTPEEAADQVLPKHHRPHTVHAIVHGGTALFSLQSLSEYLIDIQLKEKYARSFPEMPFLLPVGWARDRELSICFQSCERVVALFFVNSCGQPAKPVDVFADDRIQALAINTAGGCTLSGVEIGPVSFSSRNFHFNPDTIYVDDRMAQAHVIHVTEREVQSKQLAAIEFEEIVLDFVESLEADEQAMVKVLALDGKLLDTLEAEHGQPVRYRARKDQTLMLQAFINGRKVDTVMHKGSPLGKP